MIRYLLNFSLACALALASAQVLASAAKKYPYQGCFAAAANLHQVPLELLLAVAATESGWDADARSAANAHGIMQIQWPGTARHLGVQRVGELYNPCLNISLGARYLQELLQTFDGSEQWALAAYNYGPTRIQGSTTLPEGAMRYAATVDAHKQKIKRGLIPQSLAPQSQKTLVTFNSKTRATRLAKQLERVIEGATLSVVQQQSRSYAVILHVGKGGLTTTDHVTLNNMGWAL